ncbi:membrane protein [Streptomyces albidochromogenes]|uniref:hypothetical protein n=1 Tax=Streptomyces albidochromogenes TaxID=329524 RepID=UPI00110F72C2|nr:hypothetical protein [Streptomyces albidochromogenes]
MRRLPGVLAALLLPVVLGACGTETADGADGPPPAELRARAGESAIELIYVTEAPGFELAEQSVGVIGDDGFSAAYVSAATGGQIQLSVDRGKLDGAACPKPGEDPSGAGGTAVCERDGDLRYRATGTTHEYARAYDGHVVRVGADPKVVDRATLRRAAQQAHRADNEELDEVLPPSGPGAGAGGIGGGGMPERGDLPPVGDGAPRDEVGASG